MKRLKCLPVIILMLLVVGAVFSGCSNRTKDHSSLLEEGYIYVVTYESNGGDFNKSRSMSLYQKESVFFAADPVVSKFAPTNSEQFVRNWYYKKVTTSTDANNNTIEQVEKFVWDFKKDRVTTDKMEKKVDDKTRIEYYELVLYPEWEYYLYVDYCITYVETDASTVLGPRLNGTSVEVVDSEFRRQEDLLKYTGKNVSHSSGTAVPEDYNEVVHADIKNASDIKPMYYADENLTQRITFPLQTGKDFLPQKGKNHIKVFVKFFDKQYNIIATKADLAILSDRNYYLWRSVDFGEFNEKGELVKKSILATEHFENKVFLGNGNTISNLEIVSSRSAASTLDLGMFGKLTNSEISNVIFDNCDIYFNMSQNTKDVNCGLLAGSLNGTSTVINNVMFNKCKGYVRNSEPDVNYSPKYSKSNYAYNATDNVVAANIAIDVVASSINYYNVFIHAKETAAVSGFNSWTSGTVEKKNLMIQVGAFNERLKPYTGADANRPTYSFPLEIMLTEVSGVKVIAFGEEFTNEQMNAFVLKDGVYTYTLYVQEGIKAGKILIDWNGIIVDEYKYLVTGGSGAIGKAQDMGTFNLSMEYDEYKQTLTYGKDGEIPYYTPATGASTEGLRDRKVGYSIPIRIRLYADITEVAMEYIIDGKTYQANEVGMKSTTSLHYFEFWLKIDKNDTEKTIIVRFKDRYDLVFKVQAHEKAKFQDPPATFMPSLSLVSEFADTKDKFSAVNDTVFSKFNYFIY